MLIETIPKPPVAQRAGGISVKRKHVNIESIQDRLYGAETKRLRCEPLNESSSEVDEPDLDADATRRRGGEGEDDTRLYCRVVHENPGGMVTIPVPIAAGGQIPRGHIAVTAHRRVPWQDQLALSTATISMGPARKSAMIMDISLKDIDVVEEDLLEHDRGGAAKWTLRLCSAPHVCQIDIANVVSEMMQHRAFEGSASTRGYIETSQNVQTLAALEVDGY